MTTIHLRILRLFLIGLVFSLLVSLGGTAKATPGASTDSEPALVRVDLPNGEADLERLGIQTVKIYARLFRHDGGMILLLPANKELQKQFTNQGFKQHVFDNGPEGAGYYLLYGLPPILEQAKISQPEIILFNEGRQAIARATPDQAWQLFASGIDVQPLSLHTLIVSSSQEAQALPNTVSANPLVQRMIDQVQTTTLYDGVGDLSGEWPVTIKDSPYTLATRYTGNELASIKATRFAYEQFLAMGLPSGYHTYWVYGWERRNVLAQQTGLTQPQRIILLTAHLDSYSPVPNSLAPGADDNASGSAAVMAIADILRQYPFGCTLRYALFTGEELGLYGSDAYANYVYSQGEDIEAVLNLDMIAYNTPGTQTSLELHTRPGNGGDLAIAYLFDNAVSSYQLDLNPIVMQDGKSFSDHSSFWDLGYNAILAIEDWDDHTPSYHMITDRLGTLDLDYYTHFTKAALATFAHMGCLLQGKLSGVVSDETSGDPLPGATIQVSGNIGDPWTVTTQADGSYTLPLFQGNYDVTITADAHLGTRALNVAITNNLITNQDFSLPAISQQVFFPMVFASAQGQ